MNNLQLLSLSGILGSILMFTGDMLLYYEPVSGIEYNSVAVMGTMPINRLIAGGLIGPVASVFSIIGGFLFYLVFHQHNKVLAKALFAFFSIMFIVAGTYHAMFPNFGFIGRLPELHQSQQLLFLRTYLKVINNLAYLFGTLFTLVLFYLVIFKKTAYPLWMLLFTPTLLILLAKYIQDYIPYPMGAIVYGGWINLCFMMFFLVCFIHFGRRKIISDK